MNIPLLDLKGIFKAQEAELRAAMDRVLESQYFINGPEVAAFERQMEAFLEHEPISAVGCSNGSIALLLAMMALDIGPGDEVLVPTYSFFATVSCVTLVGATPVWVDIDPHTCNIDHTQIQDKLTDRTRAIIPVHLFGRMADVAAIEQILNDTGRRQQVAIIEDCAQSLSSRYKGRRACTFGDLSTLSFFPSKNLGAYGDGGMVIARDPDLAHKVRVLARHGAEVKYHHQFVGLNSRLDALQAAILGVKLPMLDDWSQQRRDNAQRYRQLFAQTDLGGAVRLPADDEGGYLHVYNQFNLLVERRDALRQYLKDAGVGTAIYYPMPLHLQPCFAHLGAKEGDYPVSEAAANTSLAIPVFPGLTAAQQERVVSLIVDFYKGQ